MSIRSQTSLTSRDALPRKRPFALQSVAAVLSASLLGVGLAYCACTLLIPAAAREGSNAPVVSVDAPLQDAICSSADSATLLRQARIEE